MHTTPQLSVRTFILTSATIVLITSICLFAISNYFSITVDSLLMLGIISGVLQVLGYILYLSIQHIDPNPVTWFMFAYGTAILTVLEWDAKATVPELILPTVCAVLAIVVSARCWLQARIRDQSKWWPEDWWPEDKWERWSFVSDIFITIGYVTAWILAFSAILPDSYLYFAVLTFLFLSNISTFPSFYPLLRETYLHPYKEHWAPWVIWSFAYLLLAAITFITHQELFHPLMFYPLSNFLLHGLVGYLALYAQGKEKY